MQSVKKTIETGAIIAAYSSCKIAITLSNRQIDKHFKNFKQSGYENTPAIKNSIFITSVWGTLQGLYYFLFTGRPVPELI